MAINVSDSVTACAQRDEILFDIVSQLAARAYVMDLKILRYPAVLATPPVAL
jgi:hypothetical protein